MSGFLPLSMRELRAWRKERRIGKLATWEITALEQIDAALRDAGSPDERKDGETPASREKIVSRETIIGTE